MLEHSTTDTALRVLRSFRESPLVLSAAMLALSSVMICDHMEQYRLAEEGTCSLLLGSMRAFPHDEDLQLSASLLVALLAYNNVSNSLALTPACPIIVHAMETFHDDPRLLCGYGL